jgi:hypothetical protein
MSQWYVEIWPHTEDESDEGFRKMKAQSQHDAERIERGANHNLNHEKYYTRIVHAMKLGEEIPR